MSTSTLPEPRAPGSNRRGRPKQAVYLIEPDSSFRPQRPWTFPDAIVSGKLHAKNLTVRQAVGFVFAHNKVALQAFQQGKPIESWAIVARWVKPRRRYSQPAARQEGGAQ